MLHSVLTPPFAVMHFATLAAKINPIAFTQALQCNYSRSESAGYIGSAVKA